MKDAHIIDGAALTKFINWIKPRKNFGLIIVLRKIQKNLEKNKQYIYPSFNTIAGSGPNSAIIHYRSSQKTNEK